MVQIKHKKVTGRPVSVADWDDVHVLTGTPGKTLVFDEAGVAVEVDPATGGGEAPDLSDYYTKAQVDAAIAAAIGTGPSPVTLAALSLSSSSLTVGTTASGTISGATAGSTIVLTNAPTGFTIDSDSRTWAYNGTGSATSGNLTLTETLAGAVNSPRASLIAYTVAAAPAPSAPVLTWTSGTNVYNPTFTITGIQQGDVVILEIDNNSDFSSLYGSDTNTIDADEAADGVLTFPAIPTLDYATTYYARARVTRAGQTSANSAVVSKEMDALPDVPAKLVVGTGSTGASADRSQYINVNSDGLTFAANNDTGVLNGVRTTDVMPTKSHTEISGLSGTVWFGVTGSNVAFGPGILYPNPGNDAAGFRVLYGTGGISIYANGSELAYNVGGANNGTEKWAWGYDRSTPSAPTFYVKRLRDGTTTTFGPYTLTSLIPTTPTVFVGANGSGAGGVVNFGETAFSITPVSGHTGF